MAHPSDSQAKAPAPAHPLAAYVKEPWYYEAKSLPNLNGKVAIVTGSSTGIGKEVARALYEMGAKVIVTSRSDERAAEACKAIKQGAAVKSVGGDLMPMALETSDLNSVRQFAQYVIKTCSQLHFLVCNAGTAGKSAVMNDGMNELYMSNYLGHFLLTMLLLPTLKKSKPARVSCTSSITSWYHHEDLESLLPTGKLARPGAQFKEMGIIESFRYYGSTKLLQIHMCFELQRRERGNGVTFTPVAPGAIATSIGQEDRTQNVEAKWPLRPASDGAQSTLHALLSPTMQGAEGYFLQPYFSPLYQRLPILNGCWGVFVPYELLGQSKTWGLHKWLPPPAAHCADFAKKLFDESLTAVGL